MKRILQIAVLTLMTAASGCMSVMMRSRDPGGQGEAFPKYIYPGVCADAECLTYVFDEKTQTDALYAGFAYPLFFLGLIDLPFSAVLDTICLPYDTYKVTIGGKTRYGEEDLPTTD